MVVFRHGDLHAKYALPFIEAGIPTWIDKPFAIKNEDAKKVIEASKKHNTLLTGGSTCKYAYDVLNIKNAVENGSRIGKIKSAMLNFPAELTNEYGGLYFYGAHLVEMTLAAFGYNPKSVVATEQNENVVAVLKYDNYQIIMEVDVVHCRIPDRNCVAGCFYNLSGREAFYMINWVIGGVIAALVVLIIVRSIMRIKSGKNCCSGCRESSCNNTSCKSCCK